MKIVELVEALMQIILVQEHKDKNNWHKETQDFNIVQTIMPIFRDDRIRYKY